MMMSDFLKNIAAHLLKAYEIVKETIRQKLGLTPTGRSKTKQSITEKLRRQSTRLTRIQDIAGCRVVVYGIEHQDLIVNRLKELFESVIVKDRRQRPSHGYRAVHVIVNCHGKLVEIQVRTLLQDSWGALSEKISDVLTQQLNMEGATRIHYNFF